MFFWSQSVWPRNKNGPRKKKKNATIYMWYVFSISDFFYCLIFWPRRSLINIDFETLNLAWVMFANLILVWNKLYHWKHFRMSDNKSRTWKKLKCVVNLLEISCTTKPNEWQHATCSQLVFKIIFWSRSSSINIMFFKYNFDIIDVGNFTLAWFVFYTFKDRKVKVTKYFEFHSFLIGLNFGYNFALINLFLVQNITDRS